MQKRSFCTDVQLNGCSLYSDWTEWTSCSDGELVQNRTRISNGTCPEETEMTICPTPPPEYVLYEIITVFGRKTKYLKAFQPNLAISPTKNNWPLCANNSYIMLNCSK